MAYSVGFYNPRFASDMFDVIERNFSDYFGKTGTHGTVFPTVDVKETNRSYVLHVDLPGIKEENADVSLDEQVLTITAQREETADEDAEKDTSKWLIRERKFGSFTRRFSLPSDVDPENITAHYENGVLSITVPRKAPAQAHRIAITKN
ncbi:MAG: Hsp20/alpha crystallin family protein [Spirochaetaceae bacterium]|nr:Hsp20/alpha crystallin family protein [Spirochaetaceae bacterium]